MCKCKSICGANCEECKLKAGCKGCIETGGSPFGKECIVAKNIADIDGFKKCIIDEINSFGIKNMEKVTELCPLKGSFVNLEYTLENGESVKLLDDDKIYLGYQLHKDGEDRCYGVCADDESLLVCEYGKDGSEPKIVLYKERNINK